MASYRILTFNWHEAYLCMLARTGHRFDVVQRTKAGLWYWFYTTRPVPDNVSLVHPEDALRRLRNGGYDLVVCHNLQDLEEVVAFEVPTVLLFHNYRQTELALSRAQGRRHPGEDRDWLQDRVQRTHAVFISEGKRESWGLEGSVILPGVDVDLFRGYRGDELRVLRVGNFLVERDLMMGGALQQEVLKGLPHSTLGLNSTIRNAGLSPSFEALLEAYRSHRLLLHTTRDGYEDGYNLSLLEAMASGMPAVCLRHPGSPVEHGYCGWQGEDAAELRRFIFALLEQKETAHRFGERARAVVADKFPMSVFVDRWREIFERVTPETAAPRQLPPLAPKTEPSNVLLLYTAYPATTARYLERALRKRHRVVTAGPMITEETIQQWKLEKMSEPARPQDIPVSPEVTLAEIWSLLPPGFEPDFVLWVETGLGFFPPDLKDSPVPTMGYLIDTHFHLKAHLEWAREFDHVFIAQKAYLNEFQRQGSSASWLPVACDPEIHRPGSRTPDHDVVFVGSLVDPRRVALLDRLRASFDTYVDRLFLEEMAEAFSRGHIVWNSAARGDLNMRVFEVLAAGGFLLTEEIPGSGLDELFENETHLAVYNADNLEEKVRYYLERSELREGIAANGRREALLHHTYDHRVDTVIERARATPRRARPATVYAGA